MRRVACFGAHPAETHCVDWDTAQLGQAVYAVDAVLLWSLNLQLLVRGGGRPTTRTPPTPRAAPLRGLRRS